MRFFSYLFFILASLSCSGMAKKPIPQRVPLEKRPVFPETELKQVIMRGSYWPSNPGRLKEIEEDYRRRGKLQPNESFEDEYAYLLNLDIGKEEFNYTLPMYCYNEVKVEDRERPYKQNLVARMYDEQGNIIAEDFLRLAYPEDYDEEGKYSEEFLKRENSNLPPALPGPHWTADEAILASRAILIYLPYTEQKQEKRIIRLEGDKEIVLMSFGPGVSMKKSELIEQYTTSNSVHLTGYEYDEKTQCHIGPGPM